MAPERARRPHEFLPKKKRRRPSPKSDCPFEDLKKSGNWPPVFTYPNEKNWDIVIIPNKYPALVHKPVCSARFMRGPHSVASGSGHHDLLVTRDHTKHFADLDPDRALRVLEALQRRYRTLAKDHCLLYASTFFNWGVTAGASLYHPHYQILTLPVVPPSVHHSLAGSERYFRQHRKCAHCEMLRWERKEKRRIIEENGLAISISPFVPMQPFELKVFPKRHLPYFEHTPRKDLRSVARVLQSTLRKVTKRLNDPDYNFFIHTAPLKNQKRYRYYHWHIEIVPKIQIPGGFELSTGMDINVVDPDRVAAILKGKKYS